MKQIGEGWTEQKRFVCAFPKEYDQAIYFESPVVHDHEYLQYQETI